MITKEYIEEQYKLAVLDYKTAWNEQEQFVSLNTMARLEKLAFVLFGSDYAENLHQYSIVIQMNTNDYK